jgi:probable H4MPT-linked C1 transfer pathway protein
MASEPTLGWDLGGAHLKAALLDGDGKVAQVMQLPCPLWQGLSHLDHAIDAALQRLPGAPARHAVTMTGELVDLFASRREGVQSLIEVFCARVPPQQTHIYAGAAGFVAAQRCGELSEQIASANWMASAAFLATRVPEALLVDVGSTTTDIVPLKRSILALGGDDHARLVQEELIYTGVVRTSLMAVVDRVPFAGEWVPVMAEHFATMADVYRLTSELPADADQMPSADGRGKSLPDCARRLARMVGRDAESAALTAWQRCAGYIADVQLGQIFKASQRILSRGVLPDNAPLIGAGVGRFLVMRLAQRLQRPYLDFASFFASDESAATWLGHCAPAAAVAALLQAQSRETSFSPTAKARLGRTSCG